jgi:hypothetical protein
MLGSSAATARAIDASEDPVTLTAPTNDGRSAYAHKPCLLGGDRISSRAAGRENILLNGAIRKAAKSSLI